MDAMNYMDFHGVVLYNMESDGCLNGVYTNNNINGLIFNEIARRTAGIDNSIQGDYICSYIDNGNVLHEATLSIAETNTTLNRTYKFTWKDTKGKKIFEGIGFIMNEKQVAVYYKNI